MTPRRCTVPPENFYAHFDLLALPIVTTEELANLHYVIRQEQAAQARDWGIQMRSQGDNLYISGAGSMAHVTMTLREDLLRPFRSDDSQAQRQTSGNDLR